METKNALVFAVEIASRNSYLFCVCGGSAQLCSESDSILIYLVQTNNLSSSVRGQEGERGPNMGI